MNRLSGNAKWLGAAIALGLMATALIAALPDSRLIVPPSNLIFSHAFHVGEQEIECIACHTETESSALSSDKNLPTMDECGQCHDVEDDEDCGICHRDPDEAAELINPSRSIAFNHQVHIAEGTECITCHGDVSEVDQLTEENLPKMSVCFNCHDGSTAGNNCSICHDDQTTLKAIHPADWRHKHGERAAVEREWCLGCHRDGRSCLNCHEGDNLTGNIHDLNYRFTHGLDAGTKRVECGQCHNKRTFCVDCHENELRMPLNHSRLSWVNGHGQAARNDIENCAACHDVSDPTCARAGCHSDFDGIRGTDPAIHDPSTGRFDTKGSWHDDGGYFCYQCHTNTHLPGTGFCGYCHGTE